MAVAPLVAALRRRSLHWAFGVPAAALPAGNAFDPGPLGPNGVKVEIMVDPNPESDSHEQVWTDITGFVYYRDKIKITRGRPDETSTAQPQTCTLTLNNRGGQFTPTNPTGPYYPYLGRNTPIRVSRKITGSDTPYYRFYGEVPSWPQTTDISGNDVYVQIQASGILRRLNQGTPPTLSAMYRTFASQFYAVNVLAYWPCEDGTTATTLASGIPPAYLSTPGFGTPMTISSQIALTLSSDSSFLCSQALPKLSGSTWVGLIPADDFVGTSNILRFLLAVPATGAYDTAVLARLYTTGTVARLDLQYGIAANGSLQLTGYDTNGTQLFSSGYVAFAVNGQLLRFSVEMQTSGANIAWGMNALTLGATSVLGFGSTLTSATVGDAYQVVINPDGHINDTAVGHISYQSAWDDPAGLAQPLNAWLGESATSRFNRLCVEQPLPVPSATVDNPFSDDTVTMGYQLPNPWLTLLQEVFDTDTGILYEARDQAELVLFERLALYNQVPALSLDYGQHQLSGPLQPVDDDTYTRNDVTVTRVNGGSAQQTLASGAMSTLQPPLGVGDYPDTPSLSLGTDAQCNDQAGWRVHMGTVAEPRYPTISLDLRHSTFTSNLPLLAQALNLDIGQRVVVSDLSATLQPDPVSQITQGYSETLGVFEHDMVLNTSPEDGYHIAILDDPVLGRCDTDGSIIDGIYPLGTETTILVATSGSQPTSPLWTTNAADFPFDIDAAGERMTVTNITGSGFPQTFTVVRSVNGVVKPQVSFNDVRLWQSPILSL